MYRDYIVKDLPSSAWFLNLDGSISDYADGDSLASTRRTTTGTFTHETTGAVQTYTKPVLPATSTPIIYNSSRSLATAGDQPIFFPTDLTIMSGGQQSSFTLETWFKPVQVTSRTTVLGHDGSNDGISFDGEAIRFRTNFLVSGFCEVVYFPPVEDKVFFVAAVSDKSRNQLYVDGVLVGEVAFTEEQSGDVYSPVVEGSVLVSGRSTDATNVLNIDGVAIYSRPLPADSVSRHFARGSQVNDFRATIEYLGGTHWTLTDQNADVATELVFGPWDGVSDNTYVVDGVLRPEIDLDGKTYGGTWLSGIPLLISAPVLDGSKIEWDGDGSFSVHASIDDGTSWQVCVNGREVPGIGQNFSAQGKSVSVRISFLTGELEEDTISKVRSLKIKLYRHRSIQSSHASQFANLVGSGSFASRDFRLLEKSSFMGADLYGGSLVVTPVNIDQDINTARTISMWVRPGPYSGVKYLVDVRSQDGDGQFFRWNGSRWESNMVSARINGLSLNSIGPSDIPVGDWTFVTITLSSATSNAFRIGARWDGAEGLDTRLSHLSIFRNELTDASANLLYRSFLGPETVTVGDSPGIKITDANFPPQIYTFDWSYVGV